MCLYRVKLTSPDPDGIRRRTVEDQLPLLQDPWNRYRTHRLIKRYFGALMLALFYMVPVMRNIFIFVCFLSDKTVS